MQLKGPCLLHHRCIVAITRLKTDMMGSFITLNIIISIYFEKIYMEKLKDTLKTVNYISPNIIY